jgi:hypothetical protein
MNEEQINNDNYCPDDAFTSEPVTIPEGAFDAADRPTSAFTPKYEDLTLEQKFAQHKEAAYKKFGVQENVQAAPTIADNQAAQENAKFTIHADGSMTVKKGVLGNQADSQQMLDEIRRQVHAKHGVTR